MKTITKYIADDGTEFRDELKCLEHEALCSEIADVMSVLPRRPDNDGCRFANGGGYIQHEAGTLMTVRDRLLRIAQRFTKDPSIQKELDGRAVHESHVQYAINAMCPKVLIDAYNRISYTDPWTAREYGQMYFRNNPDKAEQIQLNS